MANRVSQQLGTAHTDTILNGDSGHTVETNGHANGHANGHTNGHANGHANGHTNGHANGHTNGHANGHTNGHANGKVVKPNGRRKRPEHPQAERPVHRIAEVRQREGMSLRGIGRKLHIEVRELKAQEKSHADLRLSDLYRWQKVLDVPIADLLVEAEASLSEPVFKRAQMVRLMKTVQSISQNAENARVERMAAMLAEQLIEIMPELEGVGPWPSVGQRRTLDEFGRAAERIFSADLNCALEQAV